MSCGHRIVSRVCHPGSRNTCTEDRRSRYIYDTCADCDPAIHRTIIRRHYDLRHNILMGWYMDAKRSGDTEAMARAEQVMTESVQHVRQENFKVGLLRNDLDVLWPGQEQAEGLPPPADNAVGGEQDQGLSDIQVNQKGKIARAKVGYYISFVL